MPEIPAFCDNCGTAMRSGIQIGNGVNITLNKNAVGPCPYCGGQGHVIEGVFKTIDNAIQVISAPGRTINELNRLGQLIYYSKERNLSPTQISDKIQNELPELSSLRDFLPKTRTELYAFLSLILSAIGVIVAIKALNQTAHQSTVININQAIENIYSLPAVPNPNPSFGKI